MACSTTPPTGGYRFNGQDVAKHSEKQLTTLRRDNIGFVFQNLHLIEDLNVRKNIETALIYRNLSGAGRKARVEEVLQRLGLPDIARDLPQ